MNLNRKIESFLNQHKNTKKRLSATALLSLLIALSVVSSLIMPAVSMTISESISGISIMEDVSLYTATPGSPSVIEGTNMLDLTSAHEWTASMSSNGKYFYEATNAGVTNSEGLKVNTSPIPIDTFIEYKFTDNVKKFLEGDGPHLGWNLGNPDLTAIFPDGAECGEVNDPAFTSGIAGTYRIQNGIVEITLTQEYRAFVSGGEGTISGALDFSGSLGSSGDESGDQKFTLNGQEVVINFPDKYPTIDKTSRVNESNGTIEWTIQINNSNYVDLGSYTLTDDMLQNAANVNILPANAGTHSGSNITFNSGYKDNVTITYSTSITPEQLQNKDASRTNKAELKKDGNPVKEDSETANLYKNPFTVSKSGSPDYQTGSYGNKIDWTIKVKSEYGTSLEGYIIDDANIHEGAVVKPQGSLNKENGKWKLSDTGGASEITITYQTNASIGTNNNTANLYYPDGTTPGGNSSANVDYKEKKFLITFDKSSNINTADGEINWTITISNQNGLDLNGYTVTDQMLSNASAGSFSITPAVGTHSGDTVTLNENAKDAQWITIKYSTKLTSDQLKNGSASNTATLNDGSNKVAEKTKTPNIEKNPFTVSKTGTPDYKNGTYNANSHNIQWKIAVSSKLGVSLDGYIIEDAEIPQSLSPIKLSPSGSLTYSDGKWSISGTNGANNVTITYNSPAQSGQDNTNSAELKYPDGTTTTQKGEGSVYYKTESELVELSKDGIFNKDSHEITWTIKVKVEGGFDLAASGYTLYDEMFKNLNIDDIQIASQPAGNYAVLDKTAGTLKFTSNPSNNDFSIIYKTTVDMPDTAQTNTVSNSYGHGTDIKTAEVQVTSRDTFTKTLTSSKNAEIESSGEIVKILNWKSEIVHDGTFAGKTYSDTLTCTENSGSHYITDDQIAALKVYAKVNQYDGDKQLSSGTDYTITKNESGTGFTITFNNTLDTAGYNYVRVEYSSTAKANAVSAGDKYPRTYDFANSASFNNNPANDSFTLVRKDPVINETLDLNIRKNWINDHEGVRAAASFWIMYSTDGGSTWNYVKGTNGAFLFKGDSGYDSSSEYEVTINPVSNGESVSSADITVTGLPKTIRKAKPDGTAGTTVRYKYKLVELVYGRPSKTHYVNLDGSVYVIGYENNNGIGNTGTITVNNNYYSSMSVTPKKIWRGDTGSGNNISSITVQLEYSINGSGGPYYPVKKSESGYIFDNSSTADNVVQVITAGDDNSWLGETWSKLPQKIYINGSIHDCVYRIREIKFNDTEITGNKFIVDGGYYTISYNMIEGKNAVINEFKATKNISYSAKKLWNGDTAYSGNRPAKILVKLLQKGDDGTNRYYFDTPVELTADKSWQHTWTGLPNQSTEGGKIVTYTYEAVEVGYVYGEGENTKTVEISGNSFATTTDGWYDISYNHKTGSSEITNTFTPVSTISVTPQKKWVGDTENSVVSNKPLLTDNRPKSVTFKLQKKQGNNTNWVDVLGADNKPVTVTLTSSNAVEYDDTIWQAASMDNLPVEEIVIAEDGTSVKHTLSYRFVETAYIDAKNQNQPLSEGTESFKTENGKYVISMQITNSTGELAITNTFEEAIGINKNIYSGTGFSNNIVIKKEDILAENSPYLKTIDDKKYYVFNYAVNFQATNNTSVTPIFDQLPEGFTLVEDTSQNIKGGVGWEQNNAKADPVYILKGNGTSDNDHFTGGYYRCPTMLYVGFGLNHALSKDKNFVLTSKDDSYYYDTNKHQVWFNKPDITGDTVLTCCYAIKIEREELIKKIGTSSSYTISNVAEKVEPTTGATTGMTSSSSVKIVDKSGAKLITKKYEGASKIPGFINFSIDINPDGKNLSSGDTIDIQDLFDTESYFDHDIGGGHTTTGKKLIDVLMDNIVLYEVDANESRTVLPSNKYTLMFSNGDEVSNGSALMKLTIPDETHVVIEYAYKLIANERTPSVINGCKSSTRVNGRYAVMQPGFVPPAYDKVTFSNTARLISDSVSDESEVKQKEYKVFKSSGTISTNSLPKIKKVNTGDYTINALNASFLFAKYENGKWYYAADIDDKHNITWSASGTEGTRISSDAKSIDVTSAYQVALDETVLYKLVEISVPAGYEGSNLGLTDAEFRELITNYLNDGDTYYKSRDYSAFLENYVPAYYFSYNSILSSYPDGITSADVMQIKAGGDIEIPNNELIDIGIKKEWINPVTSTTDSQVTVELYWSYTKASSGIPDDAVLANAADLGLIDSSFSAKKTVTVGSPECDKLWTDIPNGKNSKPIYYYVKETAYTIAGVTYTLDAEGNYTASDGTLGRYMPTYIGNAANTDSVVNVRNSHQLILKKAWKNSANVELKNIPVDKVTVSIYGINFDGEKTNAPLFTDIELSEANNWKADISGLLGSSVNLSNYKSFVAEESNDANISDFVVSCVFNLNANIGEIIVTNKSTAATDASVTVEKKWSDGASTHANDEIKVTLYQSQTKIEDFSNLSTKLNNLPNTRVMQSVDENDTQQYQDVVLNAGNEWKYSWSGLPHEDENQNKYYYYVLENKSGIANASKYTESYTVKSQTASKTDYTVTNSRNAVVIQKKWLDENGEDIIPNDELSIDSITLDVLKKVPSVPESIKIQAFGDSLTAGNGYNQSNSTYASDAYIGTLLKSDEFGSFKNITIDNTSQGGEEIDYLKGKSVEESDTVVCIMLGTNNILHQVKYGSYEEYGSINDDNDLKVRIKALASEELLKAKPIFVASIPYLNYTSNFSTYDKGNLVYSQNWLSGYSGQVDLNNRQAVETFINGLIDNYNSYVRDVISELNTDGYDVTYVDINNAIKKDTHLYDGCHLNTDGVNEVAKTFASAINSYYAQSSAVGEITLTKTNNWIASFDVPAGDTSAEYYINESTVPAGWQVSYENQYQKLGSSTVITAKNTRNIPKTNLTVEKTWANDTGGEANREAISLSLFSSTDMITWTECDTAMPVPVKNDNKWTFSYNNLPAEDNMGNQLHYKIEESPMAGYTTSYGKQVVLASQTGESRKVTITNTAAVSLKLKKVWSDIDTNKHLTDSVTFKIYRAVKVKNPRPDFDEKELILELDKESVGVTVNTSVNVNANKPVTIAQSEGSSDIFKAGLSEDGKTITITGKAEGSGTITVTDGTDTKTINVTVSDYKLLLDGEIKEFTITAGENDHQLSVTKGGTAVTDVEYFSANPGVLTVDTDGKITTVNTGKAVVSVYVTGSADPVITMEITVNLPETFSITGESKVTIGSEIQLGIDKNYGTFTWSSSSDAIATVDQTTGKVTGVTAGTVTVTATRNDGKKNKNVFTVNVIESAQPYSIASSGESKQFAVDKTKKVQSVEVVVNHTNWAYVRVYLNMNSNNYVKVGWYDMGDVHFEIAENHDNLEVVITAEGKATITIPDDFTISDSIKLYADGQPASGTIKINYASTQTTSLLSTSQTMLLGAGDAQLVKEVKLSGASASENPWEYVLEDLPVYDSNSNSYVYWAVEDPVFTGYDAAYQFSDGSSESVSWIDATSPNENGEFVITVRNTKNQEQGFEMPSTGGEGTTKFYYTGGALVLLSAFAGGNRFRRRFKERRTK